MARVVADWPMVRLAAGRKGLDDDHAAATAGTRMRGGRRLGGTAVVRHSLQFGTASSSHARKVFHAGRLGQKSVVTDAMEALWQDVVEESADKLTCCERHHFVARSTVAR
jgi:hypothetical protein